MRSVLLALAALAAASSAASIHGNSQPYIATCYYGSWAVYRPGAGKFDVEDIDPYICTHHIYTFAGLDEATSTMKSLDPYNDLYDNYGKGAFTRFTNLKLKNPDLITILAIGGWNEGSKKYSEMAADAAKRATFIASAVAFVQKYNFDGMDLDWEYPAERGGEPIDKDDYVQLIKELKTGLAEAGLILSCSVGPGKDTIDDSYHLQQMAEYVDILNVMAYDYHGSWDPVTGHVAPLYLSPLDVAKGGLYQYYSVNFTVNYYIDGGVPRGKIAMGIPLYGHGFTLDHADQHGLYAPANQPQPACPYTRQSGVCGFNEICELLKGSGWTSVRDPDQKAIYSYNTGNRIWVGYDDLEAVKLKTDYIKAMGLAGSMVWSIETDDFHDSCGLGTPNPLQTAIWSNLNGDIPHPSPAPTPSHAPTVHPPTEPQPTAAPSRICKHSGLNPDPDKTCSPIFFECLAVGGEWEATQEQCATGTVFDEAANTCVWPWESAGCGQTTPAPGLEA